VYVLLDRAVTEYRWGGSRDIPFMRHKLLVLTVKKWLKSVYIYGSYRKIKTGVSLFWTTLYNRQIAFGQYWKFSEVGLSPRELTSPTELFSLPKFWDVWDKLPLDPDHAEYRAVSAVRYDIRYDTIRYDTTQRALDNLRKTAGLIQHSTLCCWASCTYAVMPSLRLDSGKTGQC